MLRDRKWTLGWVAGGQALTAAGTIVGLRILTQYIDPAVFGRVSLALAAAALALGLTCTPLTQAAMYLYPTLAPEGRRAVLASAVWRGLGRASPWLLVGVIAAAAVYIYRGGGSLAVVSAIIALLICDCWRSINICLLNAASEHKSYGTWMAFEAWARPLCATVTVLLFDATAAAVLWSYAAASLILNLTLAPRPVRAIANQTAAAAELDRRMWQYALPLVPLGLMGWANGVSDRYIITGLLSIHDTGIYAAAYGLASRPLLLVNSTFEQLMRPLYQSAVSSADSVRATRLLRYWLFGLGAAGASVVMLIFLLRDHLAGIFLGADFRSGAALMPWIAAGYSILTLSYLFERINLAHGRTKRVLAVELVSGVSALFLTTVGVRLWGLTGAAVAVPCYFSLQLVFAVLLSRHTQAGLYRYRPT
jgi:O-antigen/teichoic acid export membrane protein